MANEILNTALRTIVAYLLLLAATRIMGHKAISQMTFFNFAVGITLGSVTANLALGARPNSYTAAVVIIVLTIMTGLAAIIHIKSFRARKVIASEPVVLIDKGQIVDRNMKRVRMTLDELSAQLRGKNIFNMADVEFAILETDGQVSVLPKAQRQPLTPADLNINAPYKGLAKDLIIDGNIMKENLQSANRDEAWLVKELGKQGIKDVKDVFYAGLDSSGSLYVSQRRNAEEKHGQYGIE